MRLGAAMAKPVHNVTIDNALIEEISALTNPHLKALNETITERRPVAPDMYVTLALGDAVSVLLGSISNPEERMRIVDGINLLTKHTGYAMTPVTWQVGQQA
jgi:hypothetical protein